jgi:hypothetical protein
MREAFSVSLKRRSDQKKRGSQSSQILVGNGANKTGSRNPAVVASQLDAPSTRLNKLRTSLTIHEGMNDSSDRK